MANITLPKFTDPKEYQEIVDENSGLKGFKKYYQPQISRSDGSLQQVPVPAFNVEDSVRTEDRQNLNNGRVRVSWASSPFESFPTDASKIKLNSISYYLGDGGVVLYFTPDNPVLVGLDSDKVGRTAAQSLYNYLKQSQKTDFITGYDAKMSKYYDLLNSIEKSNTEEIELDLSDSLYSLGDNSIADCMVSLVTFGYLRKATAVDIEEGTVKFNSKTDARHTLNQIFRIHFKDFYDAGAKSLSVYVHGQDTKDTADDTITSTAWAWGAMNALRGESEAFPVSYSYSYGTKPWGEINYDLPKEFFEYYPLLIKKYDEVRGKMSLPQVWQVPDPNDPRKVTREAFKFEDRGAGSELYNFHVPDGWRLPTEDEIDAFREKYFTFNGRTFEDHPDNFILGRTDENKPLPVLQVWMIDQEPITSLELESEKKFEVYLSHAEAAYIINEFGLAGIDPRPNPMTGKLSFPIERVPGKANHEGFPILRPYYLKVPTSVLEKAEISIKEFLSEHEGEDPIVIQNKITGDIEQVPREFYERMLEYCIAMKEGNLERLEELEKIKMAPLQAVEDAELQRKWQYIYLVSAGVSTVTALVMVYYFQRSTEIQNKSLEIIKEQAAAFRRLSGELTPEERREKFDKFARDERAYWRSQLDPKTNKHPSEVIGRANEIRRFADVLLLTFGQKIQGPRSMVIEGIGGQGKDWIVLGLIQSLETGVWPDGRTLEGDYLVLKQKLVVRKLDVERLYSGTMLHGSEEQNFDILFDGLKEIEAEGKWPLLYWEEMYRQWRHGENAMSGKEGIGSKFIGPMGRGELVVVGTGTPGDRRLMYEKGKTDDEGQTVRRLHRVYGDDGLDKQNHAEIAEALFRQLKDFSEKYGLPVNEETEKGLRDTAIALAHAADIYKANIGRSGGAFQLKQEFESYLIGKINAGEDVSITPEFFQVCMSNRRTEEAKVLEGEISEYLSTLDKRGYTLAELGKEVELLKAQGLIPEGFSLEKAVTGFMDGFQKRDAESPLDNLTRIDAARMMLRQISQQASRVQPVGDDLDKVYGQKEIKRAMILLYMHGTDSLFVTKRGEVVFAYDLTTMQKLEDPELQQQMIFLSDQETLKMIDEVLERLNLDPDNKRTVMEQVKSLLTIPDASRVAVRTAKLNIFFKPYVEALRTLGDQPIPEEAKNAFISKWSRFHTNIDRLPSPLGDAHAMQTGRVDDDIDPRSDDVDKLKPHKATPKAQRISVEVARRTYAKIPGIVDKEEIARQLRAADTVSDLHDVVYRYLKSIGKTHDAFELRQEYDLVYRIFSDDFMEKKGIAETTRVKDFRDMTLHTFLKERILEINEGKERTVSFEEILKTAGINRYIRNRSDREKIVAHARKIDAAVGNFIRDRRNKGVSPSYIKKPGDLDERPDTLRAGKETGEIPERQRATTLPSARDILLDPNGPFRLSESDVPNERAVMNQIKVQLARLGANSSYRDLLVEIFAIEEEAEAQGKSCSQKFVDELVRAVFVARVVAIENERRTGEKVAPLSYDEIFKPLYTSEISKRTAEWERLEEFKRALERKARAERIIRGIRDKDGIGRGPKGPTEK